MVLQMHVMESNKQCNLIITHSPRCMPTTQTCTSDISSTHRGFNWCVITHPNNADVPTPRMDNTLVIQYYVLNMIWTCKDSKCTPQIARLIGPSSDRRRTEDNCYLGCNCCIVARRRAHMASMLGMAWDLQKRTTDPDVIWTRNLLIWSQTRYRCATESLHFDHTLQYIHCQARRWTNIGSNLAITHFWGMF